MNAAHSTSKGHWIRPLIVIALLLVAGALILWLPAKLNDKAVEGVMLTPSSCDLNRGPCTLKQEGIELAFSLGPTPIQSLKTLSADLHIKGVEPERVLLSLEGRDMYMGLNQTELSSADSNRWHGTTELAVCTTGRMVWRARLAIYAKGEQYTTWFDFEAR